jgi:hypothetical protein
MQNPYDTNSDAPDVHFDKLCRFSDAQAKKNLKIRNVMTAKIKKQN